ncbi:hypothetical protein [Sphingomonas sp.]|uniref:hypothetical protein n=1 Tax=Sphingomonas sp. TaxID=28214 RepID=UPI0035BBFAAC
MRVAIVMAAAVFAPVLLGACSDKAEERARADAHAAGFVPPSLITRVDFGGAQQRRFANLDRDGNGILSGAEMPRTRSQLMRLDRNGDDKITSSEFAEGTIARFDAMDLNHDGTLTSDERVDARRE